VEVPEAFVRFLETGEREASITPREDQLDLDFWSLQYLTGANIEGCHRVYCQVRDELVRSWAASAPGSRPWAWWAFDSPRATAAQLSRIDPDVSLDDRRWWGVIRLVRNSDFPTVMHAARHDFGICDFGPDDVGVEYRIEAEAAYLKRLRLFLPGEARRLRPEAFEDELVIGTPAA